MCRKIRTAHGVCLPHFVQLISARMLGEVTQVFVWLVHRITGVLLMVLLGAQLVSGFFQASHSNLEAVKTTATWRAAVSAAVPTAASSKRLRFRSIMFGSCQSLRRTLGTGLPSPRYSGDC